MKHFCSLFAITLLLTLLHALHARSQGLDIDTANLQKTIPGYRKDMLEARDAADSLRVVIQNMEMQLDSIEGRQYLSVSENAKFDGDIASQMLDVAKWLLVFSFLLIMAILAFLMFLKKGLGNFAFQIIGLIIVVNASLFLILTGYDQDQITPIIGLLGTIVGFIFGSNLTLRRTEQENGEKH